MKTIKQIAAELGVSKQAVHRRINREPLESLVRPFVVNSGRTLTISEQGVTVIKEAFEGNTVNLADVNTTTKNDNLVDVLQREMEVKNRLIETQAAHISELAAALHIAQSNLETAQRNLEAEKKTSNAAQFLHGATVRQNIEMDERKQRGRGFLRRIFGKKPESIGQ